LLVMMLMLSSSRKVLLLFNRREYKSLYDARRSSHLRKKVHSRDESRCVSEKLRKTG